MDGRPTKSWNLLGMVLCRVLCLIGGGESELLSIVIGTGELLRTGEEGTCEQDSCDSDRLGPPETCEGSVLGTWDDSEKGSIAKVMSELNK